MFHIIDCFSSLCCFLDSPLCSIKTHRAIWKCFQCQNIHWSSLPKIIWIEGCRCLTWLINADTLIDSYMTSIMALKHSEIIHPHPIHKHTHTHTPLLNQLELRWLQSHLEWWFSQEMRNGQNCAVAWCKNPEFHYKMRYRKPPDFCSDKEIFYMLFTVHDP